jgi:hypothetical protein
VDLDLLNSLKTISPMPVGQFTEVYGFITQEKFLRGKSLAELEDLLGFQTGRLAQGAVILALKQLPAPEQFTFGGYTQVADHHFKEQYGDNSILKQPQGENDRDYRTRILKIKNNIIKTVWAETGPERLVKVKAVTPHNNNIHLDDQYPPGQGIPQWKLIAGISARVVAEIYDYPSGLFRPFD